MRVYLDDPANQDWTKQSWDLPAHTVPELRALLASLGVSVEHFVTLPAYRLNVDKPEMSWLRGIVQPTDEPMLYTPPPPPVPAIVEAFVESEHPRGRTGEWTAKSEPSPDEPRPRRPRGKVKPRPRVKPVAQPPRPPSMAERLRSAYGFLTSIYGPQGVQITRDNEMTREFLLQLAALPEAYHRALAAAGVTIALTGGPVTDLPLLAHLAGTQADETRTWDQVGGAYLVTPKVAVFGDPSMGASVDVVTHELAHAFQYATGLHVTDEFRAIHAEVYDHLPGDYFQQGEPGGVRGCEETFAEAFALWLKDRNLAKRVWGMKIVRYLDKSLAPYFGDRTSG